MKARGHEVFEGDEEHEKICKAIDLIIECLRLNDIEAKYACAACLGICQNHYFNSEYLGRNAYIEFLREYIKAMKMDD